MATVLQPNKKTSAVKLEGAARAASLIQPAAEVEDYLKFLVYGRNGMGKTTFGASSKLKTLIVDFNEQGTLSVRSQKNVSVYRVQLWDEIDWIYWYLRAGKHDYEVVVLDTISSMAVIGMKWVLGDEVSRDASRDPIMPDKRSWGKLGQLLQNQIYNFRNLPMHVVFTAHERNTTTEDENGGTLLETHPELSPAPRSTLLGAVHVVGRLFTREVQIKGSSKKETERRLLVGPHARYVSKIRKDIDVNIPNVVRKPTLQYFLDNVLPAIPKETDGEEL